MTSWLIGTLLATSGLIVLVLLVREPVRRRFGSRVAYGLWLIPAARLLMPTLTETVERSVPASTPMQPLLYPSSADAMMMARVPAEPTSLIAQAGGWPTILITLWLGVAAGLFASRMLAFRRDRRAILGRGTQIARRVRRSSKYSSATNFCASTQALFKKRAGSDRIAVRPRCIASACRVARSSPSLYNSRLTASRPPRSTFRLTARRPVPSSRLHTKWRSTPPRGDAVGIA